MDDKFKNKYRISSVRATWWNYGDEGNYFITINSYNKKNWFGDIVDGEMVLSDIGRIVEQYWLEIPKHFPFVILDSFVVMPNHVHGIIQIKNDVLLEITNGLHCRDAINRVSMDCPEPNNTVIEFIHTDAINRVSTGEPTILTIRGGITGKMNPMFYKNLSKTVRWYKGRVCFESRKINKLFAWQTRFHDHIIRSTEDFNRISYYISTNVACWEEDCFYQDGMRI